MVVTGIVPLVTGLFLLLLACYWLCRSLSSCNCMLTSACYWLIPLVFLTSVTTALDKVGIKCFGQFLLVAHGREPSKPHFHRPIRRRISEEDRRNVWRVFEILPTLIKRNQDKKPREISRIFLKISARQPDVWVSRSGCRLKYLTVSWRYGLSKTDEALNLKQ